MKSITIDLGASFLKGALLDEEGNILLRERRTSPRVRDRFLETEQIEELMKIAKEMILKLAISEKEILLCISNEMHGFLLADNSGKAYTDYISWQRELGAIPVDGIAGIDFLRQEVFKEEVLFTGMPVRAGLPSSNLYYLAASGYLKKSFEKLWFYTLGDYLIRSLSGQEPDCSSSNAAATGLYDLRTGEWNEWLIKKIVGDAVIFPRIGNQETEFECGGIRFHALPAIGDQQAALLGAGLKQPNELSFNIGTGGQVSMLTQEMNRLEWVQIRPYFYGYYLKTVPHIPAGRALNVYVRFIEDILRCFGVRVEKERLWTVLITEAETAGISGLDCDLGFFENAITSSTFGNISHIDEHSLLLGKLMKGVLNKMADNFLKMAECVCQNISTVDRVIFSGGVAGRIPEIRKRILAGFEKGVDVICASDETFVGLYQYSCLEDFAKKMEKGGYDEKGKKKNGNGCHIK